MTGKKTKHGMIKDALMERVRDLAPDSKLPTERELCEEFDVSRMTVNKVLGEMEEERCIYRIQGCGSFVGCRCEGSEKIHYVFNRGDWDASPPSAAQLIYMKLQKAALDNNINIKLLDVNARNKASFDAKAFDGLKSQDKIFLHHSHLHLPDMYKILTEHRSKVVFWFHHTETRPVFEKFCKNWHTLFFDSKGAVKQAVRLLKEKGKKNIALMPYVFHERHPYIEGFKEGLKEAGLVFNPELILTSYNSAIGGYMYCVNLILLRKINPFDAIITQTGMMATGIQQAILDSGLNIPDDVAVISVEENQYYVDNVSPISAVSCPENTIVERAIEIFKTNSYVPGRFEIFSGKVIEKSTT